MHFLYPAALTCETFLENTADDMLALSEYFLLFFYLTLAITNQTCLIKMLGSFKFDAMFIKSLPILQSFWLYTGISIVKFHSF